MAFISGFLYYRDTAQTIFILDRGVRSIFFFLSGQKNLKLNYLTFLSFNFECSWWRLFQKRVVCSKFDISTFLISLLYILGKGEGLDSETKKGILSVQPGAFHDKIMVCSLLFLCLCIGLQQRKWRW